ncbi:MAG: hypothetical protein AAF850_05375 [Pseudomonadota bacterium]
MKQSLNYGSSGRGVIGAVITATATAAILFALYAVTDFATRGVVA